MAKREVTMKMDDDYLVIRIPLSEEDIKKAPMSRGKPNRPAKNKMVASSGGFKLLEIPGAPPDVRVAFNVIAPPEK